MKTIVERLSSYIDVLKARHRNGARRAAPLPPTPVQTPDARNAYDPYAEMRKALAATMLLG